jgi:hypothetical protein
VKRVRVSSFCLAAWVVFAPEAVAGPAADPLVPLLVRMDRYFMEHQADGVTMDSRYDVSPTEAIRQSVVCQVLGYAELYRVQHTERVRLEVVRHADYLIAHLEPIRSHGPFDGMLAYAFLAAYEASGETRFLDTGRLVTEEMIAIPTAQCRLNGGLMVAMATAEYQVLTGDAAAGQKTRDILAMLPAEQNADGSFPHWCAGTRDIHYTGWMAQELILIQRMTGNPAIEPMLQRMCAFLEERVGTDGRSVYEEPCPDRPDCVSYYYSRGSGCGIDYDTRGWTVEPGYTALLFDHCRSAEYFPVMRFLVSLEKGGTFADLYGWWPPPEDPEYPWTIADTSVANMSIAFWTLATMLTDRSRTWAAYGSDLEGFAMGGGAPEIGRAARRALWKSRAVLAPAIEIRTPAVARASCPLRFRTSRAGRASLAIFDAGGRRLRELIAGSIEAGAHETSWDLRDESGVRCASGVYFVRLRVKGESRSAPVRVTR